MASPEKGPPTGGYFYNLDPRKHMLRVSRPFHKALQPQPGGASTRGFGVNDPKHTSFSMELAYFITFGGVIVAICVYCIPIFCFFKKLFMRMCKRAPEPQRLPEEIMMQHM